MPQQQKQQQQQQDIQPSSLPKDQSILLATDNQNSQPPQNSPVSEKNDENITEKVTENKQPPAESHATLPKISTKITPASLTNTILAAIAEARAKGPTPSTPAPEQEDRRQAHILSEKKRREHINIGFEHLRSILPNCNGTSDSKATVLLKAIAYIEKLQFENSFLKQQNHQQDQSSQNGGEPFLPAEHSISKSSLDISSSNMVKQHYLGQYKRVYSFPRPPLFSSKSPKGSTDTPVSIPGYNASLSTDDNYQNSEPNPESEEYTLAASLSMLRNNSSPSSVP